MQKKQTSVPCGVENIWFKMEIECVCLCDLLKRRVVVFEVNKALQFYCGGQSPNA